MDNFYSLIHIRVPIFKPCEISDSGTHVIMPGNKSGGVLGRTDTLYSGSMMQKLTDIKQQRSGFG
jgi:hypothetical protein